MSVTISGSGQIIKQVISTTKVDPFVSSTAINTASDGAQVTGLTATITPTSALNKILVVASFGGINGVAGYTQAAVLLMRNSTPIGTGTTDSNRRGINGKAYYGDNNVTTPLTVSYLDSPATTSAVTYSVNVGPTDAGYTAYVNRSPNDPDITYGARTSCTITVYEVAYV